MEDSDPPRNAKRSLTFAEDDLLYDMERHNVPAHLRQGLLDYFVHHRPVGHFLTAVVQNDLFDAVVRSDAVSKAHFFNIIAFVLYDCPDAAWGSPEKVAVWLQRKAEWGDPHIPGNSPDARWIVRVYGQEIPIPGGPLYEVYDSVTGRRKLGDLFESSSDAQKCADTYNEAGETE